MIFDNVERLCKEKNITIAALEKQAGLANGTVRKWYLLQKSPLADHIKRVADVLGVSMEELMGGS